MQTFKVISLDMFQTLVNIQGGGQKSGSRFLSRNSAKISPGSWAASCSATISLYQPKHGRRAASSAARKYTAEDFSKYSCSMAWTMIALRLLITCLPSTGCPQCMRTPKPSYSGSAGSIRSALSVIPMSLCFRTSTGVILSLYSLPKGTSLIRMTVITGCSLRLSPIMVWSRSRFSISETRHQMCWEQPGRESNPAGSTGSSSPGSMG